MAEPGDRWRSGAGLGMEKGDPDIMDQPPRPASEPIINRFMLVGILIQTIAITSVTLTAYFLGLKLHSGMPDQLPFAETMAFATLSASELFRAFASPFPNAIRYSRSAFSPTAT